HNRWNVEKLIMSYRHLEKEEQDKAKEDKEKKRLKREMAHLDICSNKRLREIDKGAISNDENIVKELIRIKKDFEAKKK
ncbi:MAG: hypothetical protein J6P97_02440, partial [Bacteroidales bacterium]|nr:hypothetical protein [Bacteroidales bacterium]